MISKVRKDVYHLKRVWDLKNVLLWPPQPTDLQPEKFNIPWYLTDFLTSLLGGKNDVAVSSRNATIKYSMAQDIVYNMNGGKVKTPKSVLLPSVIKTLTNNTEIINIINHLGHGVLYSILSDRWFVNQFAQQIFMSYVGLERKWCRVYCQSGAKIALEKLPPCEDVLQFHILRANYQAFRWR